MNQLGNLINRIPGSRLLISSLPGSASRMHVGRSARLEMSTSVLEALPGKLDIKRRSPSILYLPHCPAVKALVSMGVQSMGVDED